MSQNHGVTKRNRRKVSKSRSTKSAKRISKTMATLKQLELAEKRREFNKLFPHPFEVAFGKEQDAAV